ncbi:EAL domain-containing protein [Arthrobacter echini]|uniref:EAL domain-containing protein n=2 Tax=Arthrobacter echini TaxID=1529066 RepID=A0A5D0XPL5_9MICC|nr:EAL domain-containing protein [Arthrobacter echini]
MIRFLILWTRECMVGAGARGADQDDAGRAGVSPRLVIALGLLALVCGVVLLIGDPDSPDLRGAWLGVLTQLAAVVVCVRAVARTRLTRWQVVLGTAAIVVYTAGDIAYLVLLDGQRALGVLSVADGAHATFYPLMLGALALTIRKLRGVAWPVLVDSMVGALAAAAVMALILAPVLQAGEAGGTTFGLVTTVVYPLLDLLLITAIGGLLSSRGLHLGPRWPLLVAGLILFCAGDIAFALDRDAYMVGSIVDAGWVLGIAGIAAWIDGVAGAGPASAQQDRRAPALPTLMVSTTSALAVLVIGCQLPIPLLAQILAALSLLLAAVPLVFRNRMLVVLASTDELTDLPNRRGLVRELTGRLRAGRPGALLFLDLDRFKDVNDALGHTVGDALLVQVSQRFAGRLKSGDFLARLGGDEFAVFLDGATRKEAITSALRLEASLEDPIEIGTASLKLSVSIGIARTPENGTDITLLMRKADISMFRAKSTRSGHHLYSAADDDGGAQKLELLRDLRTALAEEQFELHYQPKVHLADGRVTSVEALLRWNHPVLGQLPPVSFLPLAEESGLMPDLSTLVLKRAVARATQWRAEGHAISVAVNLSGSSIQESLPRQIRGLLERHALPAECLMLEITEGMLMTSPAYTAGILQKLRTAGIQISVDDFGTGYSSLAHLRDLPADELKLDRSFITDMRTDTRALGLVSSIVELAHSLELRVVAEGVDNEETRLELRAMGCDLAQGFHFTRPLPAAAVVPWLTAARVPDALVAVAPRHPGLP